MVGDLIGLVDAARAVLGLRDGVLADLRAGRSRRASRRIAAHAIASSTTPSCGGGARGVASARRWSPTRAASPAPRRHGSTSRNPIRRSGSPAWSSSSQLALLWFGGRACSRGIAWAESVGRRQPALLRQPWPAHDGRAAELARSKVADLSEDPSVIDLLAQDVSAHAARRWRELQAQVGGPG
jgi:hypothetical protein